MLPNPLLRIWFTLRNARLRIHGNRQLITVSSRLAPWSGIYTALTSVLATIHKAKAAAILFTLHVQQQRKKIASGAG
jgi:hypothetical protein